MNYPVWDVPGIGAGLVVAIVATVHVLISHVAVGGGAFLFVAEMWAARSGDGGLGERIRAWLHRYATAFIVFTTVFGALTGVGIWFAIQLASPEGTSLLIHQFVFVWATEWLIFLVEFTTIYFYYYGWRTNSARLQAFLAGAYFVAAWLSLFAINGILTFMLTPDGWSLENRSLPAAFFNPGFWPALWFRTLAMFVLAGLFGMLVASRIKGDDALKARVVLFSAKWILPAAILAPLCALWYCRSLPEDAQKTLAGGVAGLSGARLEAMARFFLLSAASGVLVVLGVLAAAFRPRAVTTSGALALLLVAQLGVAGGEFFREMARKPYVVRDTLYSNSLWRSQALDPAVRAAPLSSRARWLPPGAQTLSAAHGEWVFRLGCASCHTRDGYRSLRLRTESWTGEFGVKRLLSLDEQGVMPPFCGSAEDRAALTAYLLSLNGRKVDPAALLAAARAAGPKPADATDPGSPSSPALAPVPPPDPVGYPLEPWIVRAFAHLTLTLHFLAVHFTLGALLLMAWLWLRGASAPAGAAGFLAAGLPLGISYVVNFGVPPLLFVQTLYGQFFYSSSVLIGAFWILLPALVIAAYGGFWTLRLARTPASGATSGLPGGRRFLPVVLLGLAALGGVGFLLANNSTLSIRPERWIGIYAVHPGGGALNLGEPTLAWRWLFFLAPAPAAAGISLLFRGAFLRRRGREAEGVASARLGGLAFLPGLAAAAAGAAGLWAALPRDVAAFLVSGGTPTALLAAAGSLLLASLAAAGLASRGRGFAAPTASALALALAVACLVVLRDLVRLEYLRPVFDLSRVPIHPQWGIFAVFVGSVAAGFVFLAVLGARILPGMLAARRHPSEGG